MAHAQGHTGNGSGERGPLRDGAHVLADSVALVDPASGDSASMGLAGPMDGLSGPIDGLAFFVTFLSH